jgi:hypothetical protein
VSILKTNLLFKELYNTTSWKQIKEDFKNDLNSCKTKDEIVLLNNRYIPCLWLDKALNSVLARYTEFRNIIKQSSIKHKDYALDTVFQLGNRDKSKSIYNIVSKQQKAKVIQKNKEDKVIISFDDINRIVSDLKSKIDNDDFTLYRNQELNKVKAYHIVILLAICTGRRQIEILKTLSIYKQKELVLYSGIAKKDNLDKKIPSKLLFIDVNEAKHYLRELRKIFNLDNLTNREVNQKFSGSLNTTLNNYIKDFIDKDFKLHDLRKIYAELCFQKFANHMDKDLFYKEILAHEVKPTSATHYMDFTIKN